MVHLRFQFCFGVEVCVWAGLEVIWDEGIEGEKPRNYEFTMERRGPVLGRRGARMFPVRVGSLTCWAPRPYRAGHRGPLG